jgi:hypothetical protein
MKVNLKYQTINGRLQAELVITIGACKLQYRSKAPIACEKEKAMLKSPFAPSPAELFEEVTKPAGRYVWPD